MHCLRCISKGRGEEAKQADNLMHHVECTEIHALLKLNAYQLVLQKLRSKLLSRVLIAAAVVDQAAQCTACAMLCGFL